VQYTAHVTVPIAVVLDSYILLARRPLSPLLETMSMSVLGIRFLCDLRNN
jgi:hypothetical protein